MSNNCKTVHQAIIWGRDKLMKAGVPDAPLEAELLMAHIMGQSRGEIFVNFPAPVSPADFDRYREAIARRAERCPLQYITGVQEFMSLEFFVTPDVLIPRQDTEILTEKVIEKAGGRKRLEILDLCTGSGAIAISLARFIPDSRVTATDISSEALAVARKNAARLDASVVFLAGNMFAPVAGRLFDIIVSNPPYIPSGEIDRLMPEVRDFEPRAALDGGKDGLDFYRLILEEASTYLAPGGFLALEIGCDQAADVAGLARDKGNYQHIEVHKDYGGRDRVIIARVKP